MEIGSFDILIKQQLEPVWYRVSSKTKLIVNDLTTLRNYLKPLLQVKLPFLLYHNNNNLLGYLWMLEIRFLVCEKTCIRSVYKLQKWNLLAEILREIESDITSHATETSRTSSEGGDLSHLNNTILIMENERECSLHQIMVHQLLVMTMNLIPVNGEEDERVLHPNILLFIILTKLLLEVLKYIELYILIYHVKEKSIMVISLGRPLRIIKQSR
ncbi:DNA repair protein rad16 [Rhizophagus irregularis DAOM 181602=DAOM 197198]|nr:DNA repair protein rad16 [Rhizophagus irregularis DAOM 181602=DAOM 197198]